MDEGRFFRIHKHVILVGILVLCIALPKGTYGDVPCPDGYYIPDQDECINLVHTALAWTNARADCSGKSQVLMEPNSPAYNQHFIDAIQREAGGDGNYWIGFSDDAKNGVFVWDSTSAEGSFTYWADKEPNNGNGNDDEQCAHVSASRDYYWNDRNCETLTEYACLAPAEATGTLTCESGWELYEAGGRCFKIVEDNPTNWERARTNCQLESGDLASITSHDVNEFLIGDDKLDIMSDSYWIGLNDMTSEGEFRWLDSSAPPAFTFWKPHEPNNVDSDEHCVRIQEGSNFRWNDANCERICHYICERPATVTPSNIWMPQP